MAQGWERERTVERDNKNWPQRPGIEAKKTLMAMALMADKCRNGCLNGADLNGVRLMP